MKVRLIMLNAASKTAKKLVNKSATRFGYKFLKVNTLKNLEKDLDTLEILKKKIDILENIEKKSHSEPMKFASPPLRSHTVISHLSDQDPRFLTLVKAIKSMGAICFSSHEHEGLTISILDENLGSLLLIIDRYFEKDTVFAINKKGENVSAAQVISLGKKEKLFSLAFLDPTGNNLVKIAAAVNFVVWNRLDHYSSTVTYESGYALNALRRAKLSTLKKISDGSISLDEINRKISPDFNIDIVYTWVNDKDQEWQKLREFYSSEKSGIDGNTTTRSNLDERFQNRDELKYSLRSVEAYADFVRKIFIVTNGQVPDWLDTTNKKIQIVTHNELYPDSSVLPTFNSSSIETVLHRIKGLSEHFIYFNDDFLLGSRVTRHDFFDKAGHPKCFPAGQLAFIEDIDEHSEEYIIADKNAMHLMEKSTGKYSGNIMQHVPYPCRVSILKQFEKEYSKQIDASRNQRFRSKDDLRPIAFMQGNFGQITGDCVVGKISHKYIALWRNDLKKRLDDVINSRSAKTICLNDVGVDSDQKNNVNFLVQNFLQSYLPIKSKFEK